MGWKDPFVFSAGGRFTATNVTLADLIVMAYRTRRIQMQGGPKWVDSERFDIAAEVDEADATKGEQSLLADRFKVAVPMIRALLEDRFKLVLHRETKEMFVYALEVGKTPPKLREAKEDEQPATLPGDHGQIVFQKMPIVGFVNTIANILHVPVIERTGTTGFFDFTLDPMKFADQSQPASSEGYADLVHSAVEELGFKLEKTKVPLEITVIDRAEQPTDN